MQFSDAERRWSPQTEKSPERESVSVEIDAGDEYKIRMVGGAFRGFVHERDGRHFVDFVTTVQWRFLTDCKELASIHADTFATDGTNRRSLSSESEMKQYEMDLLVELKEGPKRFHIKVCSALPDRKDHPEFICKRQV